MQPAADIYVFCVSVKHDTERHSVHHKHTVTCDTVRVAEHLHLAQSSANDAVPLFIAADVTMEVRKVRDSWRRSRPRHINLMGLPWYRALLLPRTFSTLRMLMMKMGKGPMGQADPQGQCYSDVRLHANTAGHKCPGIQAICRPAFISGSQGATVSPRFSSAASFLINTTRFNYQAFKTAIVHSSCYSSPSCSHCAPLFHNLSHISLFKKIININLWCINFSVAFCWFFSIKSWVDQITFKSCS